MVIILLLFSIIGSVIYVVVILMERSRKPVFTAIIDADTGNGVSDILAISRALADPKFKVIGLTSSQWNQNPEETEKTVDLSQTLNDTLLKLFKREDIPHPRGGEKMLSLESDAVIKPSDASEFIVKKANEASEERKLNIITLGAMTNLATAILSDSTIIPKLRIYSSAMQYDPVTKVWNKNEFNIRNDLDALDLILNSDKLEIHIMPVSGINKLILDEEEYRDNLKDKGDAWDFIFDLWQEKYPMRKELKISDVALIEAVLNPDYAKEEKINTPPENKSRQIFVYTSVNKEFMKIDFWKTINEYKSDDQ